MFSQGNGEYQFQPAHQQAAFETAKVGLDNSQSMLSLLNEDEYSQQQQQTVNCQPLSYYNSNQITNNSYGSLPTQVQRNYMQYAQQSQGMVSNPYAATNTNYQMQQGYQRSNSYPTSYTSQHAGSYYSNTPMASPYPGYPTNQSYPSQGRSPASSPNVLPTTVNPKYPQVPQNSISPVMQQGSTMYSPGSAPVNNRTQFQFPTSPVPHPARPSPIQSPSAPKRSPAAMTCPSPIQSQSPAPIGSTNSVSPMPVRSPQNNSPSLNRSQAKQKQEMVDLSSMSKMYQPPTRTNTESDKKHTYQSPKRGGPIPKMEEMVAFIGEPIMREVLTSEKDGEPLTLDEEPVEKLSNGKCDSSENPVLDERKNEQTIDSDSSKSKIVANKTDCIHENGEANSEKEMQKRVEIPSVESKQLQEVSQFKDKLEENESPKLNNRKRKATAQSDDNQSNQKTKEKTKRTKPKSRSSATEDSPNESKVKNKNRSKNKSPGKTKEAPKKENTKESIENGFDFEESDHKLSDDDDDINLEGKRLSINRPIKTYSKKNFSKDDVDCSKDSSFDEIMKTAHTKDIMNDIEKAKNNTVKNKNDLVEKNDKNAQKDSVNLSDIQCKDVAVVVTKVDTNVSEIDNKKPDDIVQGCQNKSENTMENKQVKNPMLTPSLKRQIADDDGHDTCESDQTAPSSRKRGRPFGSKNKKKRLTKKEKELLESEGLEIGKKMAAKPSMLNPKLAVSLFQSPGQAAKPVGPVLRIVGAPEKPVSSYIVNQPNSTTEMAVSKKKKTVDLSKRIHRPTSSAAVGSTYCEMGRPWLCALCGKPANVGGLGDLYGPYYPEGFKPPKRCMQEDQSKTPNFTKQTQKAKTSKTSSKLSNSKSNSQNRKNLNDKEIETTPVQSKNNSKPKSSSSGKLKPSKSVIKPAKSTTPNSTTNRRTSSTDMDGSCTPEEIWVHEDCAVWAQGVYVVGGMIYGLHETVKAACQTSCTYCKQSGATLGCFSKACSWTSHFVCSVTAGCLLREENYSMLCPKHKNKMVKMKDDT